MVYQITGTKPNQLRRWDFFFFDYFASDIPNFACSNNSIDNHRHRMNLSYDKFIQNTWNNWNFFLQVSYMPENGRFSRCHNGWQIVLQHHTNEMFRSQEGGRVQEVLVVGQMWEARLPETCTSTEQSEILNMRNVLRYGVTGDMGCAAFRTTVNTNKNQIVKILKSENHNEKWISTYLERNYSK